ncbi:unnamed protein product [Paramecium primaurelia]|uniref:Uncharacterized protein n=1 Tax=Paramecium primaurelia TaxID=5886 RepID=A0A8S1P6F4_PARPR|nr:unnamed protein product [Paramecium primaurelia]
MRNSTLNKLSEQRQQGKNSSNLSDLTVQESSNYRLRFTPLSSPSARHKGTILMKSHETIILNMLSSTHRQIDQPFKACQECNQDFGMVHQYCQCKGITYHEKCIQDTARRNAKKQKEQAFICKNDCSYPFQINGYYMRNINTLGKWLILTIVIVFLVLLILAISIFIFLEAFNSIDIILIVIAMIALLILITVLLNKLKLNYYILYWHLKPSLIDQRQVTNHKIIELQDLLPFVLSDRDSIIYTAQPKEEDQIIEQ